MSFIGASFLDLSDHLTARQPRDRHIDRLAAKLKIHQPKIRQGLGKRRREFFDQAGLFDAQAGETVDECLDETAGTGQQIRGIILRRLTAYIERRLEKRIVVAPAAADEVAEVAGLA